MKRPRRSRSTGRGGFTLMELLTVCVIILLLSGISAGVFQIASRRFDLSASVMRLESILLSARNTAISSGVGVNVIIDPSTRRARAMAFETVGEWSFDEFHDQSSPGVPDLEATLSGASQAGGRVGSAVSLSGGGFVDCGNSPRFDLLAGVLAEAWIFLERDLAGAQPEPGRSRRRSTRRSSPESRRRERAGDTAPRSRRRAAERVDGDDPPLDVIISKGAAFALGVTPDGRLEGRIGRLDGSGSYRVQTPPSTIVPRRWMLVSMRFDGIDLRLAVDGMDRPTRIASIEGRDPKKHPPPESLRLVSEALTVGSPRGSLHGLVDEVRLRGMVEPVEFDLPENQGIVGWKKVVWFDRRGHLDARYHDRPVRIVLHEVVPEQDASPGRTVLALDFSKTFAEWAAFNGKDLDGLREEDMEDRLIQRLGNVRKEEILVDRIGVVR